MEPPPPPSEFDVGKVGKPTQTPGIISSEQIKGISGNLAKNGLDCPDNTPEKIAGYIATVKSQLESAKNPGVTFFMTSTPDIAKSKPFLYTVDDSNPYLTKMQVILKNLDKIEQEHLYYFEKHHETNDFESTSADDFTLFLTNVGRIIGQISGGNIDVGQIVSEMGDFLLHVTNSSGSQKDLTLKYSNTLFILQPADSSNKYSLIAGVSYDFSVTIEHYKEKKKALRKHKGTYVLDQRNITFTDVGIFEKLYEHVST